MPSRWTQGPCVNFFHLPRGGFQKFAKGAFNCGLNPGLWHNAREEPHLLWHLGASYVVPGSECMEDGSAGRYTLVNTLCRQDSGDCDSSSHRGRALRIPPPMALRLKGVSCKRMFDEGFMVAGSWRRLHILKFSLPTFFPLQN